GKRPKTGPLEGAERSGEPQQRFEALYGVWQSTRDNESGGIAAAVPLSERLLRMAERDGDEGLRLQAHHSGWTTWFHAGDPAKTREHADAGRLLYDPEKHASHRLRLGGHHPGVFAPKFLALGPNRCSDIPTRRSPASLRAWRWPSGSPTRSRWALLSFFLRRFTSIAVSQSEPCAISMLLRRWLRSSGSRSISNQACCVARHCSDKVPSTKQSPAFARA